MRPSLETGRSGDWVRFMAGLALLLGFAFLLSRGYTPPGPAGEVLRHNLLLGIDATPLFYTEVEDSMAYDYSGLFLEPGPAPTRPDRVDPAPARPER